MTRVDPILSMMRLIEPFLKSFETFLGQLLVPVKTPSGSGSGSAGVEDDRSS